VVIRVVDSDNLLICTRLFTHDDAPTQDIQIMLRFTLLDTADKVKNYYILRKSLEAYYSDNQEFNGYWFGRGAEVLGLKDHITDDEFSLLAENRHPKTGEQMTPRMQQNRRSGFDITFDCPKSVSLTYAFTQDDGIVRAVRQAAADTMLDMEQDAAARVRAVGANCRRASWRCEWASKRRIRR